MKIKSTVMFAALALLALSTLNPKSSTAFAQGTAFTYQGRLASGNNAANGSYDLEFSLYDVASGGSASAGPVTNSATTVSNGLFTTLVDFGPGVFTGGSNWLEIAVRTNGAGSFSKLAPRQPLTPTPYAIDAENATTLANGVAIGNGMGNMIAPNGPGMVMNSFIGGGTANSILPGSLDSAVVGGQNNMIQPNAAYSFIGGGLNNFDVAQWSVIGGGSGNIIGPDLTMMEGLPSGNSIAGGVNNAIYTSFGTVGGGTNNVSSGVGATVAGGANNKASGSNATVGGGQNNSATNSLATVGGGEFNAAGGSEATVSGGSYNIATGTDSTVPGGLFNVASGVGSFAAGVGANAVNGDSFVWADGETPFGSSEFSDLDNQFKIQAKNGVVMDVSGSSHLHPAALYINSTAPSGVGLYVAQTNSTDAAVVINSCGDRPSSSGGGDILKGFGWSPGNFGSPNQLVFEVTVLGDVNAHSFNSTLITSTSDRNAKENFSSISPAEILKKVTSLPVSQWNFKGEHQDVQHIGPMAQDFHTAFGLNGAEDKRISLTDEGGVALAAIQGLNQKVDEKNAEIQNLEKKLDELQSLVKQLAAQK